MPLASDGKGNFLTLGDDGQWTPATRARNPETGAELVLDGAEWKPLPDAAATQQRAEARSANSGVGGFLSGTKRAVENGLTFGFRDEAAAGIDATVGSAVGALRGSPETWSDRYSRSLGRERAQSADFQDQHPAASVAGNLVGGVVAPGPAFGSLLRGAGGAGAAAVRSAAAGATGGALAGFGEGEGGLANRAESAALGGGLGAAGGAALGAGVNVGSRIGGRLLDVAGLRNPETAAERQILRALERDNRPLADVAAEAAAPQGGAPLALADLGGRNTTNLAAVAANVPGRSMEAADQLVQLRHLAGPDRVATASDHAFGGGSGGDIAATTAAREAARKAAADPLYNQVRAFGAVDDPDVAGQLLRLPDRVFSDASEFARLAGRSPERLIAQGDGGRELARVPTTEDLDHVVRALGDSIDAAQRAGNNGLARALTQAKTSLTTRLDDIIVDPNTGQRLYQDARAAYAGPSAQLEATEAGRTAFRTDRDTVARQMQNSAPDVQDAYRLGAGRALSDMASDPNTVYSTSRRMLGDRQMQDRLESLLPQDRRAALAEALQGEVRVNAGNRAYSPRAGSPTQRLKAGMNDMEADPPGGMVMALLNATQKGGLTGAMAKGGEVLYRRGQGINSSTADALAQRLFTADPQRNAEIVRMLTARKTADTSNLEARRALIARLLQGAGTTAGITAN